MTRRPIIAKSDVHSHGPLPFPRNRVVPRRSSPLGVSRPIDPEAPRDPAGEVLAAFADVSRRIEDLARELKCFGYFDDGHDRPRAA